MNPNDARTWCQQLAAMVPKQQIDRPGGVRYLDRYYVGGWSPATRRPGPAVFLHHFLGSDDTMTVHSHPWVWAASLILVGAYREYRCDPEGAVSVRDYLPGEVNILQPGDRHRIELLTEDVWTLFLAGAFGQAWAFSPACPGASPSGEGVSTGDLWGV
jgi:hypothetical protein